MTSPRFTIFVEPDTWHLGWDRPSISSSSNTADFGHENQALSLDPDTTPSVEAWARVTAEAIRARGGGIYEPVVLALPSSWCLCATIDTQGLGRSGRRKALSYLLEEHLPISAEESVADYIEQSSKALGVAARLDPLNKTIAALEAQGLSVRHACPAALLAAADTLENTPSSDTPAGVLLESTDPSGGWDLIELRHRRPVRWGWYAHDAEDLAQALSRAADDVAEDSSPVRMARVGSPPPLQPDQLAVVTWSAINANPRAASARHGAALLDGRATPLVDLRRGDLALPSQHEAARKPATALFGALALLLICLIVALQWRQGQYRELRADLRTQQAQTFREALPDQRLPRGSVRNRLRSEWRKLEGFNSAVSGRASGASVTPGGLSEENVSGRGTQLTSALTHLHDILTGLPTDLPTDSRFRITDLSIEPDRIRLEGQATSHSVAEQLAAAVRASGRFDVTPPNSRALRGSGVSFGLTITPAPGNISALAPIQRRALAPTPQFLEDVVASEESTTPKEGRL